jgi:hypothetical protein
VSAQRAPSISIHEFVASEFKLPWGRKRIPKYSNRPIRLPEHAPGHRYAWVYRCAEVRASTRAGQNARTSGVVSARDGPAFLLTLLSQGARARSTSGLLLLWVWPYSARSPPRSRRMLCQGGFGESWSPTGRKCGKTLGGQKQPRRTCCQLSSALHSRMHVLRASAHPPLAHVATLIAWRPVARTRSCR